MHLSPCSFSLFTRSLIYSLLLLVPSPSSHPSLFQLYLLMPFYSLPFSLGPLFSYSLLFLLFRHSNINACFFWPLSPLRNRSVLPASQSSSLPLVGFVLHVNPISFSPFSISAPPIGKLNLANELFLKYSSGCSRFSCFPAGLFASLSGGALKDRKLYSDKCATR